MVSSNLTPSSVEKHGVNTPPLSLRPAGNPPAAVKVESQYEPTDEGEYE